MKHKVTNSGGGIALGSISIMTLQNVFLEETESGCWLTMATNMREAYMKNWPNRAQAYMDYEQIKELRDKLNRILENNP